MSDACLGLEAVGHFGNNEEMRNTSFSYRNHYFFLDKDKITVLNRQITAYGLLSTRVNINESSNFVFF